MSYYARIGEARYDEMCHALDLLAKGEISETGFVQMCKLIRAGNS